MGSAPNSNMPVPPLPAYAIAQFDLQEQARIDLERRAVFRLIFILAFVLGAFWTASGHWNSTRLARELDGTASEKDIRIRTLDEKGNDYLMAVVSEAAGI